MARSVETPWKPATTATLPSSSASRRRSLRISRILALRWAVSVTMPACEPVNETAASPRSMMAMQSSAIEMRSPEVSSMSISRAVGSLEHLVGEALEVVGGLAHGRDDDHDVVAGAPGAHDVLRHGADPVGVGDGGAAELLHEQAHDRPWYREARLILPSGFRVGRLPRRAQGHQTRTPAPEPDARRAGDAGGGEAQEAQPHHPQPRAAPHPARHPLRHPPGHQQRRQQQQRRPRRPRRMLDHGAADADDHRPCRQRRR